jgi:SAM-dependent methyltransferase
VIKHLLHSLKSLVASVYWLTTMGRWGISGVFDAVYEGQPRSQTFRAIFREVFGNEFPEEVDASGMLTLTDLRNIAADLHVGPGNQVVDLACGRGGATLWVAQATGANFIGIDLSSVAIRDAQRRISEFSPSGRMEFRVGDIAATRLPAASLDGAMSIDALFLVPDKFGTFAEVARILKPQARFAFTTWELDEPARVKDYRPLLTRFGFRVEVYQESPGWLERQRGVHERVLAAQDQLRREMGEAGARVWINCAHFELAKLSLMRRIYVVATKI